MQFKVGDKFKVVGNIPCNKGLEGKIGTVVKVFSTTYKQYEVLWEESGGVSENWTDEGDMELISNKKEEKNMAKFYRVKKETPAWEAGAVVSNEKDSAKYKTINDLWDKECIEGIEYWESLKVVESSPEWFERVYPVNLIKKTVYKLKAQAQELLSKEHSE